MVTIHDSPLAGVTVLDLSRLIPGPYATLLLAHLGAQVIKVEPPGVGDYLRLLPPAGPDGMNPIFTTLNRGKRSIVVDLNDAEGRRVLRELARRADVLVESFRPGVLDRFGVGLETLRRDNPRLITCSLAGYAADGPLASAPGHDLTYQAVAGALCLTDAPPAPPVLPLADLAGGLFAALGVVAALAARNVSGEGRHVSVTLEESIGALLILERAEMDMPFRFGDVLRGGRAGYRLYQCSDGRYLALAALEEKFWNAFCDAVGRDAWRTRFADIDQTPLAAEVAALLAERPAHEWEALLRAADVPCAVAATPAEARAYAPLPFAIGRVLPEAPAPRHGEHTAAVLREWGII
ncbi:MAG: CoA transferase [Roseiflexus sp.]|nr:CoA transferase [Roseiflexus sp.]MCS7288067.1 CoA transferase [Roseiflexus sp.]MDW8233407.1 CaiB/BaiF CoA-transferase family protein [Roseiflexaceae bacterium]